MFIQQICLDTMYSTHKNRICFTVGVAYRRCRCSSRTNVLPGEERFEKGFDDSRISQELLQYLKQQTLMVPPPISEMQRIQNNMDNLLYRTNPGEDQKAKQHMQLQNEFLNYKHELKSLIPEATLPTQPQEPNQISTNVLTGDVSMCSRQCLDFRRKQRSCFLNKPYKTPVLLN